MTQGHVCRLVCGQKLADGVSSAGGGESNHGGIARTCFLANATHPPASGGVAVVFLPGLLAA